MDANERVARILVLAAWADRVATAAEREVLGQELAAVGWTLTARLLIEWPPAEGEAELFAQVQALAAPLDAAARASTLAAVRRVLRASEGESYRGAARRDVQAVFAGAMGVEE